MPDVRASRSGLRYSEAERQLALAVYLRDGMAAAQAATGASRTIIGRWAQKAGARRHRAGSVHSHRWLTREQANAALLEHRGNIAATARALGVPTTTLRTRLWGSGV